MDMSVLEWKKVNLFNIVPLPFVKCPAISETSCFCYNESKLNSEETKIKIVVCNEDGFIFVYFSNWDCITFKSPTKRNNFKLCSLTSNKWLATVTQDTNYDIHIDIFDLTRLTRKQGAPIIASAYFQVTSSATCINAESIDEKLLTLAVGFENGDLLLHYGKMSKLFSANIRQYTVSGYKINGIHFEFKAVQSDISSPIMFVTCVQGVYCFLLKEKSLMEQKFVLDNNKNNVNHCCTMRKDGYRDFEESMLVVGRSDAVYCYTCDGRGPCFAIEGIKKCLAWLGHYLIVVVKPKTSILQKNISTVIIVDTDNKIIVFYKEFQDWVCTVCENDFCYIISHTNNTGNVFLLEQCSIKNKIRLLIEKNMYDIALRLLHREGFTSSNKAALVRFQYGNYLLLKGDISRAVNEFKKTIGFIRPYAVISKLLYSRYNDYLIDYLSESRKTSNVSIHVTKLLECCKNRKQIQQELSSCTHLELKDFLNLLKIYFGYTQHNYDKNEEEHLMHTLLEFGPETLIMDPTTFLENIKSESAQNAQNILSFFSILPDYNDYCSKILADIIKTYPASDEKIYFYLLILYLALWRGQKVTTRFVLDFLKNKSLRLDKALIMCRLYSFLNGINELNNNQQNAATKQRETVNRGIHTLIKKNPNITLDFNISERSFLMMLKSSCYNEKIKSIQIKPVFKEKIISNIVDSANELKLISDLKDNLKKYSCTLSLYTNNPIEFRNDLCDICRETLNTQTIYFLCQHSFHKECLHFNSEKHQKELKCVICNAKNKYFIKKNVHLNSDSSYIISVIAKVVSMGIMNQKTKKTCKKEDRGKRESVSVNNPFD
ncbi:uncharacterized protein LOC108094995 [Drosophila ficusphila]|uniref:uncharacterized protein LOC108094995 n=1 Tax=Drosophila ficusphila TaxID=30025 RepID=UPI001C8AEA32|nr:uncharacterized protein LOC108094995 [Drosophila ficusphila]